MAYGDSARSAEVVANGYTVYEYLGICAHPLKLDVFISGYIRDRGFESDGFFLFKAVSSLSSKIQAFDIMLSVSEVIDSSILGYIVE